MLIRRTNSHPKIAKIISLARGRTKSRAELEAEERETWNDDLVNRLGNINLMISRILIKDIQFVVQAK